MRILQVNCAKQSKDTLIITSSPDEETVHRLGDLFVSKMGYILPIGRPLKIFDLSGSQYSVSYKIGDNLLIGRLSPFLRILPNCISKSNAKARTKRLEGKELSAL